MTILGRDDIDLSSVGDGAVRLTIMGNEHVIPADLLAHLSKIFGNVAADALPKTDALPAVTNIYLTGFKAGGLAIMRLDTTIGPLMVSIDANWLKALASAADAALEFADTGGRD